MRILLYIFAVFIVLQMLGCERSVSMATLDQTAADIFNGSIVVDENGKCTVDVKNNVVEKDVYVTTQSDGSKLILFRTWQGKGSNLRGFLYTNGGPLTVGTKIEVITFQPPGPSGNLPIGLADVSVDSAIKRSCYLVSRSLD